MDPLTVSTSSVSTSSQPQLTDSLGVPITFFDPEWLEDVVWVAQRVNRHSLTNKWLLVEETKYFTLEMKEKRAITSQRCRILVKGAPHLPLQLSCGMSVEFLYPTWEYLRQIESSGAMPNVAIPARYKEVEEWMLHHVKEFQDSRLADASVHGGVVLAPHANTPLVMVPEPSGAFTASTSSSAASVHSQPMAPTTSVRSRVKEFWARKMSKPVPAASVTPSANTTSPSHGPEPSRLDGVANAATAHSHHDRLVTKRAAFADFLRRKLRTADSATTEALLREHHEQDDFDPEDDHDSPPHMAPPPADGYPSAPVEMDHMKHFRLSFDTIGQMYRELRADRRVHPTFDRLFRRRRACTQWQYLHREELFEQVRANRTIAAMVLVALYTALMHFVTFDLYCLLLLCLELGVFHVMTNYRSLAFDMGRRAAKTRVDRVKDWFFFGVTRRKMRADDEPKQPAGSSGGGSFTLGPANGRPVTPSTLPAQPTVSPPRQP